MRNHRVTGNRHGEDREMGKHSQGETDTGETKIKKGGWGRIARLPRLCRRLRDGRYRGGRDVGRDLKIGGH